MSQSPPFSCSQIDGSFGPHAGNCRGGFDFTLLFEETILTLAPVCLVLAVIPPRIWYLLRRVKKVQDGSRLASLKIVRIPALPASMLILKILGVN